MINREPVSLRITKQYGHHGTVNFMFWQMRKCLYHLCNKLCMYCILKQRLMVYVVSSYKYLKNYMYKY